MALNTAAMAARKRFGQALQEVRKAARLPSGEPVQQGDVARALGYKSYHRVSRMERGETWPNKDEWKILVKFLAMDLAARVRLETMRTEGMSIADAWWTAYDGEFPESLLQFIAYEDASQRITTCAVNVVPALLQTRSYARAITKSVAGSVLAPDAVERSVELRRSRRGIFDKPNPTPVEFIFGEAALRQHVGGTGVMLEQLDSLIEDDAKYKISIRVVPFTAEAASMYMMHLLEFGEADEKPITAFDSMTGMTFQKRPREVRENRHYIEAVRNLALSPLESMAMVKEIRKEMSSA
ncbi:MULTISPECIES: helix-turn-helix transcriptional regulator [unclassified Streptomyces]|uniref:helix-turn-helix domain-containing protein n=1 Tax=unclassified Streptomyces TaxID=2593676 RepID=UPI00336ADA73